MTDVLAFLSAASLAVTFAWSGAVKVLRAGRWRAALAVYRIPKLMEPLVFAAVPVAEIAVAGLIVIAVTKVAGALSVALLCAFCAALVRAHKEEGDRLPCGCFGGEEARDYRLLLLRNVALLLPASILMLGRETSLAVMPDQIDPVPALLGIVGIGVAGWTAVEVTRALKRGRHH